MILSVSSATVIGFSGALAKCGLNLSAFRHQHGNAPDGRIRSLERQAAVRYWKRAIAVTAEVGCKVMNSEFNGRPGKASLSEAQFWKSLEELLPVFEREGIELRLEPHPDDFVEDGR